MRKQTKKSFLLGFLKAKKGRNGYDQEEDGWGTRKVYPSEEDSTFRVVAEPGIDRKASAFIANFHATRLSEIITMQAEPEN
ncbi:putative Homeodomain-like/winged-helix DNA-binding family protein [Hibiscus syriacus]|uniref:Homeodomain-like/winged-helix DNA-binding family protein n=1 Tax=Hibiscus syriacus TaxID=106335 RepID=A0A6A3AP79_HIBSY|nr:putative Homeodomain-like/winged-helix DNA-binding family protein [Hibiscus syriacus]